MSTGLIEQGRLTVNDTGRWEIIYDDSERSYGDQLTSGSLVEVKIGDAWIRTRIECADGEYYSTVSGVRLYRGMPARLP